MKRKNFYLAGGLFIVVLGCFFYNKKRIKDKLDNSITNGDKITATSLSDAENKTSSQTSPVNIDQAKALGLKIASLIAEKNNITNRRQRTVKQNEIDIHVQKLFEMGYKTLPNGTIEKV
jgi:ribosomal protein L18